MCEYSDCMNKGKKCFLCRHQSPDGSKVLDMYLPPALPKNEVRKKRNNYKHGIRAENIFARKYGGTVVPGSGALGHMFSGLGGDVSFNNKNILAQVKTRSDKATGGNSIRLLLSEFDKHWEYGLKNDAMPILAFSFYDKKNWWVVFSIENSSLDADKIRMAKGKSIKFDRDMLVNCPLFFSFDEWLKKGEKHIFCVVPADTFFKEYV